MQSGSANAWNAQPDLAGLRATYLSALLEGDRRTALKLLREQGVQAGASVAQLSADVVQAAQHEIGRLWQENAISIAQEHQATAIAQVALAYLYDLAPPALDNGKKVLVACVEGELHEFPARLVADALDLAGFHTEARYGARGRKHADEDSAYHVSYLVEALRSDNPDVMTRYAYWLRSVLVPRGMCSAHLDENFERLALALCDESRERTPGLDLTPALAVLTQARAALRYEQGAGSWFEVRADELKRRVRARVLHRYGREPAPAHARIESLLSYLADALQLDRPELFVQHIAFLAELYRARGTSTAELAYALRSLREALEGDRADAHAAPACSAVRALSAAEGELSEKPSLVRDSP